MVFLNIDDLSVDYPTSKGMVSAVQHVCLPINENESLGIAGESGCGKSTLGLSIIRMLQNGLINSGKIEFDGKSILDLSESEFSKNYRWGKISMIFQGAMNSLDPVFTIQEQFYEILKQHRFQGNSEKIIHESLDSVSLDYNILKKFPHELSGGMKQRVIIAMALLLSPKLVIADEPTTALDVLIQAQVISLLKNLKQHGMSVILITHDLAILSEIADKIAIMYGGQIVEFGNSKQIYTNPLHPYTKALIKSIPTLHGEKPSYIKGNPPSLLNPKNECCFIDRCPLAIDKCKKSPPSFKTDSGYVKCWLYE